jgi:hypothetical protein
MPQEETGLVRATLEMPIIFKSLGFPGVHPLLASNILRATGTDMAVYGGDEL